MIVGPATKPQRGSRSCNRTHTHTHTRRAVRIGLAGTLGFAGLGLMAMAAPPVSHDFNADGANDYPVSVTGFDPTDPVNGAARMWSGASKAVIDTIVNPDTNTLFGWSIGSAGDLDADGFDDLIVGEPLWGPDGSLRGRVQVFSGDDSSVLLSAAGPYWETGLGRYVAGIGDWNGDAVLDLAVSGWDIADTNSDGIGDDAIGIVFVLSGADGSVLTEIIEPTATALFGYSVFGLGDITGDGLADIAVVDRGAPGAPGSGAIGQLYIFAGRAAPGALTAADAHRTIANADPTLRGFAAQVDTMHPDLWLDEPTLQIISLTSNGVGGPNQAETAINIRKINGQPAGTKGLRPTLVLAGDINLDGKVNALDLQESIAQLGTNPQATGVMPIADLNEDSIIDLLDVALLLDGYGGETDIYEGLWDGSRLLATVGANAGFGTIGGGGSGSIGGNWGVSPGRRPIDGCGPHAGSLPPPLPNTIVDALLRQDARRNCADCPPECLVCDDHGSLSGGSVTASPSEPLVNEPFTFTAYGVSDSGGSKKCDCGTGSEDVPSVEPDYVWCVVQRNQDGSWPEPPPPGAPCWRGGNTTDAIVGSACSEFRAYFRVDADRDCPPEEIIISGDAKVGTFRLEIICDAATPSQKDREKIGILEGVRVQTEPPGTAVNWEFVDVAGNAIPYGYGDAVHFTAPYLQAHDEQIVMVIASSGDCERDKVFLVVTPQDVQFVRRPLRDYHSSTDASAGFAVCVTILPTDVSFTGLTVGEKIAAIQTHTNNFDSPTWQNYVHPAWTLPIGEDNKVSPAADFIWFRLPFANIAGWAYGPSECLMLIPWEYGKLGYQPHIFKRMSQRWGIRDATGLAWISKGRITVTFPRMAPGQNAGPTGIGNPNWNLPVPGNPAWVPPSQDCP